MSSQDPSASEPPLVRPHVLELRIHGVNNTPPAGMLDLPADAVEMVAGDELASFWRPKPDRIAPLTPHDRGYVRPDVTREAYSWGGMARNSVGGSSGWQKILAVAARVGWMLLLPFGLINVAYWSRRLDGGPGRSKETGSGAGTLRVLGLLMTLLMLIGAAILSMDLVGVQCYASPKRTCSNLPSQLGFLQNWNVGERLALLSLVPLMLIVGLWALSAKTRTSYDRSTWADADRAESKKQVWGAATATKSWPLLATSGFWQHHVISAKTAFLHLAAGMTLLAMLTSWDGIFGTSSRCTGPWDLIRRDRVCWHQLSDGHGRGWAELVVWVLGAVLLVVIFTLTVLGSSDAVDIPQDPQIDKPKHRGVLLAIGAAAALFTVQEAVLIWWHGTALRATHLVGISAVSNVLACLLFGISLSALYWRRDIHGSIPLSIGLGLGIGLLLCELPGTAGWILRAITIVAIATTVWLAIRRRKGDERAQRYEAWRGCIPGVAVLVALLIAMTLTTAVVVGVADLLNGANTAASLADKPPASPVLSTGAADLRVPQPIVWFGVGLIILVALLVLIVLVVAELVRRKATKDNSIIDPPPVAVVPPETPTDELRASTARKLAQIAHRGESALGLVVVLGGIGLLISLLIASAWTAPAHPTGWQRVAAGAVGPGMWVSATLGATLIAFVAGGSALGKTRPFGLLWDVTCFLPRAGHPLGPPCYAERAVPELVARYNRYLSQRPDSDVHGDKIILSAHSLGGIIAVASIFAVQGDDGRRPAVSAISLLTYGCQLRAYFGRLFPELLGPNVLGNHPARAAGLINPNPVVGREPALDGSNPGALAALLGAAADTGRWRNLWRRTDYLGFPAFNGLPDQNNIDQGAEEIDRTGYMLGVLTHSDYPLTPAYTTALTHLIDTPNAGTQGSVAPPV